MTAKHTENKQVVVSMTSFPEAIPYAIKAIRSLLMGSVVPDKLVLYLTFSQFQKTGIPEELQQLAEENPIFEVRDYNRDIRSYRKLIPALIDFPEAIIVTVDDDVWYHQHMLRDLLSLHAQIPNAVLAHRAKRISIGKPYRKWSKYRWYHFLLKRIHRNFTNIQTGVGGVLYPPHSLKEDMLDVELFTKLAPSCDDIWFWAAATRNGFPVIPVPFGRNKPRGLHKPKEFSLKSINFKEGTDRNAMALKAILEHFPDIQNQIPLTTKCSRLTDLDIDLVYLWVDGSDPSWIAKRNACLGTSVENEGNCKGRFANNDELKYSLRAVEKYAPWIRKIFLVTDNQVPQWLDTSNPKVQIVDLTEILPAESLPCFNSVIIEHHLHKIPGLAEHFLYSNDDMFINKPVSPATFFAEDGLPIVRMRRRFLKKFQVFYKEKIRGRRLLIYTKTVYNAALLVEKKLGIFFNSWSHHNIDAYKKSTYAEAREMFDKEIGATLGNHTRSANDIQRILYSYVALATDQGHLCYVNQHTSFFIPVENQDSYKKFLEYNPMLFCLNDSQHCSDEDRAYATEFISRLFPEKSQFEK